MEHIVFVEATMTGAGLKGIESAKKRGLKISFLTRNKDLYIPKQPNDINMLGMVDRILDVETNSVEEVCRAVEDLNKIDPITAIITFVDFYVPQAAAAAEMLGLPTIPYQAATNARNKYLARTLISKYAAELNPRFFLVNTVQEAICKAKEIGYPLIIKPQDEADSLDVMLIKGEDELIKHFDRITSKTKNMVGQKKAFGGLLLEEYIQGQEYSVETFQGGKDLPLELMGITRKYLTGVERGCFIEIGHCFPVSDHKDIIIKAVSTALKILGIHTAACHTELKILNGQVKIMEINPRLAGGGIGSHLVEAATGINPVDLVIDCARGMSPTWNGVYSYGAAIYKIASQKEGKIKSLPDLSYIERSNAVIQYSIPLEVGQQVHLPLSNGDLLGYIITKSDNPDNAFESAKELAERIYIDIEGL